MYRDLLQQLDAETIGFSQTGTHLLGIFLAVVMYGVALGLKPNFFRGVFNRPRSLFIGLACQWVVLPLLTFLLCAVIHGFLSPSVAMGLILVASCPGGAVSNFMSSYSKGNSELSVLLSTITTLGAPIFTPINYAIWGGLYVKYFDSAAHSMLQPLQISPLLVSLNVIVIMGIPIILGFLTVRFAPRIADRLKEIMRFVSIAIFIGIAAMMLSQNFSSFRKYICIIFIIVFVHNLVGLGIGYTASSIWHVPVKDRRTVTLEVGIQNSGLGLMLLLNPSIFPADIAMGGMVFVTAWWGIWHIISGLGVSALFRFTGFDSLGLLKRNVKQ